MQNKSKAYYLQVLGLSSNFNEIELKDAYRREAKKWHPYLNKDDIYAEERLQLINEAYAFLKNSKNNDSPKRKSSNSYSTNRTPKRESSSNVWSLNDIFSYIKIFKPPVIRFISLGMISIPIILFTSFYNFQQVGIRKKEILSIVSRRCAQYEFQDEIEYCQTVYSPSNKEVTNFSYFIDSNTKTSYINEALNFYEKAWQKYRAKDFRGALVEANQYIKMVPYDYLAINDRGVLLAAGLEDYENSIKDFNKAIEINPKHNWAYLNRARSEIDLGNFDKGIKDIEKHLTILPNDKYALEELEIAKRKSKRRRSLKGWATFFQILNQGIQGYNQGRWGGGYQPNYDSINLQNQINSQKFHMNQQLNMQKHNMRMQQHNFNMQQNQLKMRNDLNQFQMRNSNPY